MGSCGTANLQTTISECLASAESEDHVSLCAPLHDRNREGVPGVVGTAWVIVDVGVTLCEVPGPHDSSSILGPRPIVLSLVNGIYVWFEYHVPCTLISVLVSMHVFDWCIMNVLVGTLSDSCCSLSPMGAYGHPNAKPTILFGTTWLECKMAEWYYTIHLCVKLILVLWGIQPRPYIESFKRKMTEKDKRRIKKNKAVKKFQMVKKTINKNGKVQVWLGNISNLW